MSKTQSRAANARSVVMAGRWRNAFALAGVAGWVDATGFIALDQLFTGNMTGNTVFMSTTFAQGQWLLGWPHFCAIPVFLAGIFAGTCWILGGGRMQLLYFAEAGLLVGVGLALAGGDLPLAVGTWRWSVAAAAALLAMGVQNSTVRRLGGVATHTTYVTGLLNTWVSEAARSWMWWRAQTRGRGALQRRRAWRVLIRQEPVRSATLAGMIWLVYAVLAFAGGLALVHLGAWAVAVPVVALVVVAKGET